jgi:heme/copper-type cytochrome/quinol oxidase subunit 2
MEQLTVQSLGFPIGFQEDIKIIIIIIITITITVIIVIVIVIVIVILACPDARCESGQTSGSCRNIS